MKIRRVYRRAAAVVLTVCMICCNLMPAMAAEATATSLRLTETEGTVDVTNNSGKNISVIRDMKLYNGYHVETQEASYAWINLDSTKLTKLDAVSEMEIRQKGRELELMLNSGNLYFNVTAPLADDETLNIRTSTMVTGIRGTCGWVKVIDQYHTLLYVLEGTVQSGVADPVSGQIKTAAIHGGEVAEFVVYPKDKKGDKCDIFLKRYGEADIDGFVWAELAKDQELCKKIEADSGLDIRAWLAGADEKLQSDQAAMHEKLAAIAEQLASQDSSITVDPVWVSNDTESSSGSGGSGSSGETPGPAAPEEPNEPDEPEEPSVVTFTMKVAAQVVHDELQKEAVKEVILLPSSNPADNTLDVDVNVTVPEGKKLTMNGTINMDVQSGQTLQVDGTVDCSGDVTNSGTINVTSSNTLKVGGAFVNNGSINNTSTGRIAAANGITNESGTFSNAGRVEGSVTVNGGILNVTGGEVTGNITHGGGNVNITGGTVHDVVQTDGEIDLNGGIPDSLTMLGGSLTLGQGTLDTELNLKGTSRLNLNGGEITRPVQAGGDAKIRITGGNAAEGITLGERASLDMSGGSVPEVNVDGGMMKQTGGTVGKVVLQDASNAELGGDVTDVVQSGGTMAIGGGTIGNVQQSGGTSEMTGGIVQNGYRITAAGTLAMSGGTIEVGKTNAALIVGTEGAAAAETCAVTLTGGVVDGRKETGVLVDGGTCSIAGDAQVRASEAYSTVVVNAAGNGTASIQWNNEDDAQNIDENCIYTCRRAEDGELYLTKSWADLGIREALENAEAGEIVTMRREANIGTGADDGQEEPLDITRGTKEDPVELDLKGHRFTVSVLNVEPEEETAAFRIFSTADAEGDVAVRGSGFVIGQDGCLILENSVYGENLDRKSSLIKNNGYLSVQNGAELTVFSEYGLLSLLDGSITEIGGEGTAELSSTYGGGKEYEEPLIRMEGSAYLSLNKCRIDGNNVNALYIDGGDAEVKINEGALITSGCSTGTVHFAGWNENVDYEGGMIQNRSKDYPAIFWESDEMPYLPDRDGKTVGTEIGAKGEAVLAWDGSEEGDDSKNLGYSVVGPKDDYYYISIEDPEAQIIRRLATPSQLDEIADEDFWFDDDILDEDEEYIKLASASNASPSNAFYEEDDDDYDDDGGYEANVVREAALAALETSAQETERIRESKPEDSAEAMKDEKKKAGESEEEKDMEESLKPKGADDVKESEGEEEDV